MNLQKLEEMATSELREHGSAERLDRVWKRLEPELSVASPRARRSLWWAPAAAAIIFGAGILVGARWFRPEPPSQMTAEVTSADDEMSSPASATQAPVEQRQRGAATRPTEHHRVAHRGTPNPSRDDEVLELPDPAVLVPSDPLPSGSPVWKQLYDSGDVDSAERALDAAGGFDAVVGSASPAQLMSLVDIERSAGSRDRAVVALRRMVENFPEDPQAPEAAWTLGNLLEQAGDGQGATEAFALYRRLSPGGDFAEDSLAREVESALKLENVELAAGLVDQYAKDFPAGRRLEEFKTELERLRAGNTSAENNSNARSGSKPAGTAPSEPNAPTSPSSP